MKWNILTEDETVAEELESEVLFAVDEDDEGNEQAIIADISADGAWISAPVDDARTLSQWR